MATPATRDQGHRRSHRSAAVLTSSPTSSTADLPLLAKLRNGLRSCCHKHQSPARVLLNGSPRCILHLHNEVSHHDMRAGELWLEPQAAAERSEPAPNGVSLCGAQACTGALHDSPLRASGNRLVLAQAEVVVQHHNCSRGSRSQNAPSPHLALRLGNGIYRRTVGRLPDCNEECQ